MPDEIKPALTPEEWEDPEENEIGDVHNYIELGDVHFYRGKSGVRVLLSMESAVVAHGHLPRLIALANAALPDGHPQKITRDDVAYCNAVGFEYDNPVGPYFVDLAAKLAALLPPEP